MKSVTVNVSSNLSRHQVDKLQHLASVFSLNNRGRKLYLTQIYYSVFDQSEQGLPRCSLLSVLLTGCFLFFFVQWRCPLLVLGDMTETVCLNSPSKRTELSVN